MPENDLAAVWHRIQEALGPIEPGMQPDGIPEISSSLQCEDKQEPDDDNARRAHPILPPITQVHEPETHGQQDACRPETDQLTQAVLQIAPEQKLFIQPHEDESEQLQQSPLQNVFAVLRQSAK